jgi:predicted metal-dependent phosphoesterase TrpH
MSTVYALVGEVLILGLGLSVQQVAIRIRARRYRAETIRYLDDLLAELAAKPKPKWPTL